MSSKHPASFPASRGDLFIIAAPSGGGKTSLVSSLFKRDPRLVLSVSHTTRSARPGEIDGQHYRFVSVTEFEQMVMSGEFMEYARVFDHYYGTQRESVERLLEEDRDVILEIDWQGARQVRDIFPACCAIFIIPPSLEILRERLTRRGQDSASVVQRRMQDAQAEISHWNEFDQLVVNDNFNSALEELTAIINDHRNRIPRPGHENCRLLAQQLGRG